MSLSIGENTTWDQLVKEAVNLYQDIITREKVEKIAEVAGAELSQSVFYVTGIEKTATTTSILASLSKAQKKGISFSDWKKELNVADHAMPDHRKLVVYRNFFTTVNSKAYFKGVKESKALHYLEYNSYEDKVVRKNHLKMDGIVRPKGDKFWVKNLPPNGHNCRCLVSSMSSSRGKRKETSDEELRLKVRAGAKPDRGWSYNKLDANGALKKLSKKAAGLLPKNLREKALGLIRSTPKSSKSFFDKVKSR